MAEKTWTGSGSANVSGSWSPSGVPGSGDDCVFNSGTGGYCSFDLTSVKSIQLKQGTTYAVTLMNDVSDLDYFLFGGNMEVNNSGTDVSFSGTPANNDSFVHFTSDAKYVSGNTTRDKLKFRLTNGGTPYHKFFGGSYPHLELVSGNFTPQTQANSTGNIALYSLTVVNGANMTPSTGRAAGDRDVVFEVETTGLTLGHNSFDGGDAKWIFQAHGSGVKFPVSGTYNTYGNSWFTSSFRSVEISCAASGNGSWMTLPQGSILEVEELKINSGAALVGISDASVMCPQPDIRGTWSFTEISPGWFLHREGSLVVGLPHGGTGRTDIGTAGQVLKVNSGANALEWGDAGSSSSTGGNGLIDLGPIVVTGNYATIQFGNLIV